VIVAGKRVKTIDVHCHCVIPKSLEVMGKKLADERGPGLGEVGAAAAARDGRAGHRC
jgi:hypothetical protein